MRLIDADKLRKEIHMSYSDDLGIREVIDKQPTTYDVDKVVKRLEDKIIGLQSLDTSEPTVDTAIKELQMALEIIKSGGID